MKSKLNIKSILIIAAIGIISLIFFNPSFAANTAKVKVEVANIRKTADANSVILEQVSKNQEVEILEKSGDWYKIKFNKIEGYLRKDLLDVEENATEEKTQEVSNNNVTETVETQNQEASNTEAVEETATQEITAQETTKQEETPKTETVQTSSEDVTGIYKCKENVKLKIIPLILGKDIKEINKDAEINVLEINNKWALVESGTNRGWVLVSKIEKVANEQSNESEEQKIENQPEQNEQKTEETKVEETKTEEPKQEETAKVEETKQEVVVQEKTMYINSEVVNLRKEESTSSDKITQLTKATQVTVVSENNGWSKVKVNGKEGYILSTLLSDRKPETTTSRSLEETRQETKTTEKQETTTDAAVENKKTTTATKAETTSTSSSSTKGQEVCNYARQFLGCKYVYGGTTPSGFDCSGFTQYVFKHFGVTLNRTAEAQASNGTAVSKSNLKAGDLLIFSSHAGIYLGDGTFIHAANPSKGVIITSLSDSYYVKNYITARRIFN